MNDEEKRIEWDVPQPTLKEWLMVSRRVDGEPSLREHVDATIDDLKRACEAVGLVVVDEGASWKDQSIKDWAELAKRQTVWLGDVRKALDPNGISHADIESMASATVAARDLALAEVATLRAQLAELSAEHRSMVAASLRELEVLRGQLAASEAEVGRCREERDLNQSFIHATCRALGSTPPDDTEYASPSQGARAETAEAQLAAITSSEGRATDGDLEAMADEGYRLRSGWNVTLGDMRKLARDVAARVRRERGECLVERLVAKGYDFRAEEVPGSALGHWKVLVQGPGPIVRERSCVAVAADVPVTLARLAGLDGGQ